MKFGVSIPHFGRPVNLAELLEIVRQTEALSFDSVCLTEPNPRQEAGLEW